jgi:hypothetical protein
LDISGISTDQTEYMGKIILYSVQPRSKLAARVADPDLYYFWNLDPDPYPHKSTNSGPFETQNEAVEWMAVDDRNKGVLPMITD